jgi:hypothetical protein
MHPRAFISSCYRRASHPLKGDGALGQADALFFARLNGRWVVVGGGLGDPAVKGCRDL